MSASVRPARSSRLFQTWTWLVTAPHRQRVEAAPAGGRVEQGGAVERVLVELVRQGAERVREVDEPALVGPAGEVGQGDVEAEHEVRRVPGLDRRRGPAAAARSAARRRRARPACRSSARRRRPAPGPPGPPRGRSPSPTRRRGRRPGRRAAPATSAAARRTARTRMVPLPDRPRPRSMAPLARRGNDPAARWSATGPGAARRRSTRSPSAGGAAADVLVPAVVPAVHGVLVAHQVALGVEPTGPSTVS